MAIITKEEFLAQQAARAARAEQSTNYENRPRVNYLSLKNDGDEAIVRFAYETPDQLYNDIVTVHDVVIDGRHRKVNCLRSFSDPIDKCPLCESGSKVQQKIYLRLIEYVRNDDGSISALPRIWERPAAGRNDYLTVINNLFTEYGDISDCVFKVKRNGAKGDIGTNYTIMFGNPSIYNPQAYQKDFSAFENYKIIGGPVLDRDVTKMRELVGNAEIVESAAPTPAPVTSAPTFAQPQQTQLTYAPQQNNPFTGGQRRVTFSSNN